METASSTRPSRSRSRKARSPSGTSIRLRRLIRSFGIAAAVLVGSAPARADVGIVVTGEATIQPQLAKRVETWLREHGHDVMLSPMPPDAIGTFTDCFLLVDETCAKNVVEVRAKSKSLVFARVLLRPGPPEKEPTYELVGYWFDPGRDPVAERRECERCTDSLLREQIDDMLKALSKAHVTTSGHLYITSQPAGAKVLVDNTPIGITPLSHDLPPGPHRITIAAEHRAPTAREVVVRSGQTTVVDVPLPPVVVRDSKPARDRTVPLALVIGGAAGFVTGTALYFTSETDTGEKLEYRDTRLAGAMVGTLGLAAAGVGAYLWYRSGKTESSAPTLAVTPGGATVGWASAF